MKFKVNGKEYNVSFGYKPTLKANLLSRIVKNSKNIGEVSEVDESMKALEDLMIFIPDMLLVGLQKHHSDEFGYDYDTNNGYDEKLDKVFDIVSTYVDEEGGDIAQLYNDLEDELENNSFLKQMLEKMMSQETQSVESESKTKN